MADTSSAHRAKEAKNLSNADTKARAPKWFTPSNFYMPINHQREDKIRDESQRNFEPIRPNEVDLKSPHGG
jgi:hypothetical protein